MTSPTRSTAPTTTSRSEAGRPDIMHDSAPAAPTGAQPALLYRGKSFIYNVLWQWSRAAIRGADLAFPLAET